MDIEEITGPGKSGETDRLSHPAAPLIEQAMMGYGVPGASVHHDEPEREIRLGYLRAKARSAYQSYQVTRYDATGRILPELIRDVETATRMAGAASPAACAVRALVYDTAAALLSRVGEPFLAWAASDRAMAAAEYSGDPLLAAVGAWRLSYIIADHTGQVNHMGTAFGHVNVAIHRRLEVCIGAERLTEAPMPPFGSKVLEAWRGRSFGRAAARATSNL